MRLQKRRHHYYLIFNFFGGGGENDRGGRKEREVEEKRRKARRAKTRYLQKNTEITYFKTLAVMPLLGDPSLPLWNCAYNGHQLFMW